MTLTPNDERLAVELSLPTLVGRDSNWRGERSNRLRHSGGMLHCLFLVMNTRMSQVISPMSNSYLQNLTKIIPTIVLEGKFIIKTLLF